MFLDIEETIAAVSNSLFSSPFFSPVFSELQVGTRCACKWLGCCEWARTVQEWLHELHNVGLSGAKFAVQFSQPFSSIWVSTYVIHRQLEDVKCTIIDFLVCTCSPNFQPTLINYSNIGIPFRYFSFEAVCELPQYLFSMTIFYECNR